MLGSLEDSTVFSTICFSGSIIGDRGINSFDAACREHDIAYSHSNDLAERHAADNRFAEKARKRITAKSRSHSRLGSYEDQNEDWYGFENKEEEEQADSSDSETRRLHVLPLLGVLGSLVGGAAGVAKAVNDSEAAQCQLEELQRHNRVMEGRGVYLAPYKRGQGVARRKKNVDEMLQMPRGVTTDVQLQQLANRMRISYFRGGISSYTLTVSTIFDRRRNSNDIWQTDGDYELGLTDFETYYTGYFNFCVSLNMLLGFCEDYKRVVVNARHELILIRARNDYNCLVANPATEPEIELFKVQWRMPHVSLNEINKLSMLRALESGRYLSMSFRSWDLYEYPLLQNTTKHSRAVKTATQLEKPRYIIFALKSGRKNIMSQDVSVFDDCNLSNVKVYLNSDFYPYSDLNLDFGKKRYAVLFDMYARFRKAYYGINSFETLLNVLLFIEKGPFTVIDCSRQNESVKSATVDVRIEFDCKENVPANTTAYCLIIHDRVIEYCPLSNVVRKIM
ncbi:hypothetical protein ALC57_08481 [Trachymyrmex cornetzi]|uniref:Double jelly roll-like domain-containing protein n=1 Tax=Trachymyrmex cornetzi TaxID=471704 RepID=A0A151J730_9HYME|nr:hypothetical protein ALC57_08481 [Trachymyrmex cornetzi]